MNDINELRNDAKTAHYGHLPLDVSGSEVLELLDRLEEAEKERDELRAKIAEMERQEPVAWMSSRNGFICKENKNPDYNVPLYALPGAKGETK